MLAQQAQPDEIIDAAVDKARRHVRDPADRQDAAATHGEAGMHVEWTADHDGAGNHFAAAACTDATADDDKATLEPPPDSITRTPADDDRATLHAADGSRQGARQAAGRVARDAQDATRKRR